MGEETLNLNIHFQIWFSSEHVVKFVEAPYGDLRERRSKKRKERTWAKYNDLICTRMGGHEIEKK